MWLCKCAFYCFGVKEPLPKKQSRVRLFQLDAHFVNFSIKGEGRHVFIGDGRAGVHADIKGAGAEASGDCLFDPFRTDFLVVDEEGGGAAAAEFSAVVGKIEADGGLAGR